MGQEETVPTITWLHLSDLHFRTDELARWNEAVVLRTLIEDIEEHKEAGLSPDLILVSGDIAAKGKSPEYTLARAFFDELLIKTGLEQDRVFVVPGNHDVDRSKIGTAAKLIEPNLTSRDAVNEAMGDTQTQRLFLQRFRNYASFVKKTLERPAFDDGEMFYVASLELKGCQVAVLGLNSAWLAHGGEEDRNRLVLGERQVRGALDAAEGADLRLALLHHPFDWLQDFDRDYAQAMLRGQCDLILHGHLHHLGLLQERSPDSNAFCIAAGACYESREYYNAYNLVRLDPGTGEGTAYLRTYSDTRGGFWTEDSTSYRNLVNGTYSFALGRKQERRNLRIAQAQRIEETRQRESASRATRARIDALVRARRPIRERIEEYLELERLAEQDPDWQDKELTAHLKRTFEAAVTGEQLAAEALAWFGEWEDEKARECCRLLQRREPDHGIAAELIVILDHRDADRSPEGTMRVGEYTQAVEALKEIRAACGARGRRRIDQLLQNIAERAQEFEEGVPEEAAAWRQLRAEATDYAQQSLRWFPVEPLPAGHEPMALSNWLHRMGLSFNPFGPEDATLDPHLWRYGVEEVFDAARGRQAAVILAPQGGGKTSAARLLAWDCLEPPDCPREDGVLPVYYTLALQGEAMDDPNMERAAAARAVAQTLARYLTHREDDFLALPKPRKYGVARLLSFWSGSRKELAASLNRLGRDEGTNPRLVREIRGLYQKTPVDRTMAEDYLDLLADAIPGGVECIYLLGDLPGRDVPDRIKEMTASVRSLLPLAMPLAARGVYLKLFVPEKVRNAMTGCGGCQEVVLAWTPELLTRLLKNRLRQAGGQSLAALCRPPDPEVEHRLVQIAGDSPRRLVRAGNALILEHASKPDRTKIEAGWAMQFLEQWERENRV